MKKKLPIGTKVFRDGKEHTILAYNDGSFLVDNWEELGHQGNVYTWYDENSKQIPYVNGDHRYWIHVEELNTFSIVSNKEPEFIFNI